MTEKKSLWDGDGLPEEDEEALDLINELELFPFEVEAIIEACKREAWVRERVARHEQEEHNLQLARFFWRRVERWRAIDKLHNKQIDAMVEKKQS